MRFPSLAEVIACNEAVREPDEVSATAALIARWFIRTNTDIEPDQIIKADDPELGDLLIGAAPGDDVAGEIHSRFHRRALDPRS